MNCTVHWWFQHSSQAQAWLLHQLKLYFAWLIQKKGLGIMTTTCLKHTHTNIMLLSLSSYIHWKNLKQYSTHFPFRFFPDWIEVKQDWTSLAKSFGSKSGIFSAITCTISIAEASGTPSLSHNSSTRDCIILNKRPFLWFRVLQVAPSKVNRIRLEAPWEWTMFGISLTICKKDK